MAVRVASYCDDIAGDRKRVIVPYLHTEFTFDEALEITIDFLEHARGGDELPAHLLQYKEHAHLAESLTEPQVAAVRSREEFTVRTLRGNACIRWRNDEGPQSFLRLDAGYFSNDFVCEGRDELALSLEQARGQKHFRGGFVYLARQSGELKYPLSTVVDLVQDHGVRKSDTLIVERLSRGDAIEVIKVGYNVWRHHLESLPDTKNKYMANSVRAILRCADSVATSHV
ncbi:MAG: hypothetical protein QF486_02940 [Candidatus Woesearchaeota archaeon]|jgi:hypothetical protein|nr:hypothetical protein [Candidatus Woesearchaeota archaeon]MDP7181511.1 hypothetical protein [Candidatus Woesearchaeota archaeon]MDP7198553.1 hypothetical protein [Candidatus Woesearchaeota archaeon]MDP7466705.1 hypothetical protein [Candidatus Woesearchaeota archaeon]MDP7647192.1 hypothetical protein [Candidatus Woesearchaeota archaeon]